jgi:hypothetical protein
VRLVGPERRERVLLVSLLLRVALDLTVFLPYASSLGVLSRPGGPTVNPDGAGLLSRLLLLNAAIALSTDTGFDAGAPLLVELLSRLRRNAVLASNSVGRAVRGVDGLATGMIAGEVTDEVRPKKLMSSSTSGVFEGSLDGAETTGTIAGGAVMGAAG